MGQPQAASDGEAHRYSCQFTVRGHWRNQWYARSGTHAPKFIEPFIKGPKDAPFKEVARVYAVER